MRNKMIFKQLNKASCKTYLIGSENTKRGDCGRPPTGTCE